MKRHSVLTKLIGYLITLLALILILSQPANTPRLAAQVSSTALVTSTELSAADTINPTPLPTTNVQVVTPTPTDIPQFTRPEPGSVCGIHPKVGSMLLELEKEQWVNWIALLSGEKPVRMNGETYTIQTRFSESMFNGDPNARAYDFVFGQLQRLGYDDGVNLIEHEYTPFTGSPSTNWKNIIVLIPGSDPELAQEQILMTAHLDSISKEDPQVRAPGADDNGSGVATLLEAASLFKGIKFKRTIKIVFFTGEETGLHGSRAYINSYRQELEDVVGVFNLDMFGYDANNDRCFEMHVGWLKGSNVLGGCLADTIEAYHMDLNFEYLIREARGSSDHVPFWNEGIGAVEVLENFDTHQFVGGCGQSDINPNYHTENDLLSAMNTDTGHEIAKAAIAAVARLAEPLEP